jgi:RNA polymerase sigma-70 factor (ECF subfamily)
MDLLFTSGFSSVPAVISPSGDFTARCLWRPSWPAMPDALTTVERDDAELVRLVAHGDQTAFSELYDRFAPTLLAVAVRVVHDAQIAEDVVQDVFVHIWEKATAYTPERGRPLGWAVVMTRNRAIDKVRARGRSQKLLERAGDDLAPAPVSGPAPGDGDRAEHVRGALADLSDEQRAVIELAFFGGLSQSEIAERTSKPLGTVKAHIRRGMLKLRDKLQRFQ